MSNCYTTSYVSTSCAPAKRICSPAKATRVCSPAKTVVCAPAKTTVVCKPPKRPKKKCIRESTETETEVVENRCKRPTKVKKHIEWQSQETEVQVVQKVIPKRVHHKTCVV